MYRWLAGGSVESIELTDDNLAEVEVDVDEQLHEGTTAVIRATSLSGVANHYVSISPGPNSNPPLDDGATLGLASTTTPVDLDQLFNTFPPPVRKGLQRLHQGQRGDLRRQGRAGQRDLQVLRPGAQPAPTACCSELNADQRLLDRFIVNAGKLVTAVAERGDELSSAISNANTAFGAIASQNVAFDETLQLLPPVLRQANTTFVNLRAALDDLDPLVDTAKPATKDLGPVPAPNCARSSAARCRSSRTCASPSAGPGEANDLGRAARRPRPAAAARPPGPSRTPNEAIDAFQPNLNFARAYTPDIFNGFAQARPGHRLLRRQRPLRARPGRRLQPLRLRTRSPATWNRSRRPSSSTPSSSPAVSTRCPGGATQPTRRLQPLHSTRAQLGRQVRPGRRAPRPMRRIAADNRSRSPPLVGAGRRRQRRRRRRRRRLQGPRDLRQRRLHGQRRGGPGRRRQRRQRRVGRRHDAGRDRPAYEDGEPARRSPGKAVIVMDITDPGFQDFRERRHLPDPARSR